MPSATDNNFSPVEIRSAIGLASIYGVRMLGLFMILPVFSLYARDLEGVTPTLIGLAIGIYGLTQALFQIPLGMLSDKVGRKPVIIGGLIIFALGSVVAATSTTILGIVIGRALQGSGAIAAATLALAADLTREEIRTRVMAFIGLSIGMAFMLAMIAGPILDQWVGVPGIFWITACLAVAAIGIILFVIPTPVVMKHQLDTHVEGNVMTRVLKQADLLRLDYGIFSLHFLLTANFIVLPILLKDHYQLDVSQHWKVYLPVMLISFFLMLPFIIMAEKHKRMKPVFLSAILLLVVVQFLLFFVGDGFLLMLVLILLFFAAFNLLEASLPSLVTKTAPADAKGTAMGVYSTSQFLGIFAGGLGGGWIMGHFGLDGVFLFGAIVGAVWFLLALGMSRPQYLGSILLPLNPMTLPKSDVLQQLLRIDGVREAVIIEDVAYLKVDKQQFDPESVRAFSTSCV